MAEHQVFVLDDDVEINRMVERSCRALGVAVATFTRIEDFKRIGEFPPGSVILLDLGLADGNGVDILRFLAEQRCQAMIFLMSGVDERLLGTVQRVGLSYGLKVGDTLPKPFRLADLKARLDSVAALEEASGKRKHSREGELHRAILGGELVLHYQPKTDLGTGAMIGAEALVRWQHPQRGLLQPAQFVPFAEENGLIAPLTHWVLNEALRQVAEWLRQGLLIHVGVNLPAEMLNDLSVPGTIERLLLRHEVPGSQLSLEITETGIMRDMLASTDVLARLRLMGISLAIDDFGTGHSSILKLRQLPFNELKIDRSFVQDMAVSPDASALIKTMIAMGQDLGMLTIAEGVEDAETLTLLRKAGCDQAQGYHISRPIPADALLAWARAREPGDGGASSSRQADAGSGLTGAVDIA